MKKFFVASLLLVLVSIAFPPKVSAEAVINNNSKATMTFITKENLPKSLTLSLSGRSQAVKTKISQKGMLPQTGDSNNDLSIIGVSMILFATSLEFYQRKIRQNSKVVTNNFCQKERKKHL